jgi:hypothetical protein
MLIVNKNEILTPCYKNVAVRAVQKSPLKGDKSQWVGESARPNVGGITYPHLKTFRRHSPRVI